MNRKVDKSTGEIVDRGVYSGMPDLDYKARSDESALFCEDASLTDQSGKEEADVNVLLGRFGLDGSVPAGPLKMPQSGDFSGATTFQQSMDLVVHAREQFQTLPARARARFHNDVGEFLEFMGDPDNAKEAIKLGLAVERLDPVIVDPNASVVEAVNRLGDALKPAKPA